MRWDFEDVEKLVTTNVLSSTAKVPQTESLGARCRQGEACAGQCSVQCVTAFGRNLIFVPQF